MKKYRLEITMESRRGDRHKYIKRSFPVEKGTVINLSGYGWPYSNFGRVEINDIAEVSIDQYATRDTFLELIFDTTEKVIVWLNSFTTVKKQYSYARPMFMPANPNEVINTTFYLYIE